MATRKPARTTVAPYSLRAREEPTVAAPVSWEEVEACSDPGDLRFLAPDVLARVDKSGDPLAEMAEVGQKVPEAPKG